MKIRSILIGALALGFAAGCSTRSGKVAGVDVPGVEQEQTADGQWLEAKVGMIDHEAGTVSINVNENAEEIDLQSGQEFTVNVDELPALTGMDATPEEVLEQMSEGEEIRVQLTDEDGELTIHRIGTEMLE